MARETRLRLKSAAIRDAIKTRPFDRKVRGLRVQVGTYPSFDPPCLNVMLGGEVDSVPISKTAAEVLIANGMPHEG